MSINHPATPAVSRPVTATVAAALTIAAGGVALLMSAWMFMMSLVLVFTISAQESVSGTSAGDSAVSSGAAMLGLLVLVALVGTIAIVAGVLLLRGSQFGWWAVLVVSVLGIIGGVADLVIAEPGEWLGSLLPMLGAVAVLVLTLVPATRNWVRLSAPR